MELAELLVSVGFVGLLAVVGSAELVEFVAPQVLPGVQGEEEMEGLELLALDLPFYILLQPRF